MKIEFCGAARSVTGSCHMLTWDGGKLLVDCGMRQGADAKGNYGEDEFPFDPAEIDAVLLTHAHIDHSGLLPLLVKRGFSGTILCTDATAQLSTIMLPDSAHIQQQDAEWQTRKNLRSGKAPVEPLYTIDDVNETLKLYRGINYEEVVQLFPTLQVRYRDIGHLLGSAAIEVWAKEGGNTTKIVFSGDIGRSDRPIIEDPKFIDDADYLLLEGTYGGRTHPISEDSDKLLELSTAFSDALARGGNIIIPAFAVGRTQELLYYIKHMLKIGALPGLEHIPVYLDSPLGIEATKIYERCADGYYDEEATILARDGSPFDFPSLHITMSADESRLINSDEAQKIIISSSGMCDAGRIRHHLKHNLYNSRCTVMFLGYQAQGTLGRMLVDGAKKVKLFGEDVRVNAAIVPLEGFSGHADQDEIIAWVKAISPKPKKIILVHGETGPLLTLAQALQQEKYDVSVPYLGDGFDLTLNQTRTSVPHEFVTAVREQDHGIREQVNRIIDLLERNKSRRSPDMPLKLSILEADIKTLADKWETLL